MFLIECAIQGAFQDESYNYAFSTTHTICMCKCLYGLHALLAWQSGSKAQRSASDPLGQNCIPGSAGATGHGAEIHRPLVAPPSEAHWLPRDPTGARGSCPSKPARRTFDQSACLGVAQWPFLPAEPQHPEGRHRGPKAAGHSAFGGFPCRGLQIRWRQWCILWLNGSRQKPKPSQGRLACSTYCWARSRVSHT